MVEPQGNSVDKYRLVIMGTSLSIGEARLIEGKVIGLDKYNQLAAIAAVNRTRALLDSPSPSLIVPLLLQLQYMYVVCTLMSNVIII